MTQQTMPVESAVVATATTSNTQQQQAISQSLNYLDIVHLPPRQYSSSTNANATPNNHVTLHFQHEPYQQKHLVAVIPHHSNRCTDESKRNGRTYKCPFHHSDSGSSCRNHHASRTTKRDAPTGTFEAPSTGSFPDSHQKHILTTCKEKNITKQQQKTFDTIPRNKSFLVKSFDAESEHGVYNLDQRRYSCPIETVVYLESSEEELLAKHVPENICQV